MLTKQEKVAYLIDNEVLVHKWSPANTDSELNAVSQIVIPTGYRQHVLSVAHESQWSGHLGVTKTYQLILRHFFCPGLKSDVSKYDHCCHVCQIADKPNQIILPAPLHPISIIGVPFERTRNSGLCWSLAPYKEWQSVSTHHYMRHCTLS